MQFYIIQIAEKTYSFTTTTNFFLKPNRHYVCKINNIMTKCQFNKNGNISYFSTHCNLNLPLYQDININFKVCRKTCGTYINTPEIHTSSLIPVGASYSLTFNAGKDKCTLILDTGSSTITCPVKGIFYPKDSFGNNLPTYKLNEKKYSGVNQYIKYDEGSEGMVVVKDCFGIGNKRMYMMFGAGIYGQNNESLCCKGGIIGLSFSIINYSLNFEKINIKKESCANCTQEIKCPSDFWKIDNFDLNKNYPSFMEYIGTRYSKYQQKFGYYARNWKINFDVKDSPDYYGKFILGSGEEQKDLYVGELTTFPLQIIKDFKPYLYQIKLVNIQFKKGNNLFTVDIEKELTNPLNTNFIDSGTTLLKYFWNKQTIIGFADFITSLGIKTQNGELFFDKYNVEQIFFEGINIPNSDVVLEDWPEVIYNIEDSAGNSKSLFVSPSTYFEQNNNETQNIGLEILEIEGTNWNILGLVFLSQNYVVFDYANKLVKIAPKK